MVGNSLCVFYIWSTTAIPGDDLRLTIYDQKMIKTLNKKLLWKVVAIRSLSRLYPLIINEIPHWTMHSSHMWRCNSSIEEVCRCVVLLLLSRHNRCKSFPIGQWRICWTAICEFRSKIKLSALSQTHSIAAVSGSMAIVHLVRKGAQSDWHFHVGSPCLKHETIKIDRMRMVAVRFKASAVVSLSVIISLYTQWPDQIDWFIVFQMACRSTVEVVNKDGQLCWLAICWWSDLVHFSRSLTLSWNPKPETQTIFVQVVAPTTRSFLQFIFQVNCSSCASRPSFSTTPSTSCHTTNPTPDHSNG